MKTITGIIAIATLVAAIICLVSGHDKAFFITWIAGCFTTIVFLRLNRIGHTDPRASKFAKKYF